MAKLRKLQGEEASAAYSPQEGHSVAVYTYKFKPEHYSEGVDMATRQFVEGELKARQKRYNVFLRHPSTHELVNISFFGEGEGVGEWHESSARRQILEKVRPFLEAPIDVQVYEVEHVSGVG
jgi:O-acetyl-ADP-ribose deacetylase (regulator of RNase III)